MKDYRAESYLKRAKKTSESYSNNGAGSYFSTTGGKTGYASSGVTQIKEGKANESGNVVYSSSGGGSSKSVPVGAESIQAAQQQAASSSTSSVAPEIKEIFTGKPVEVSPSFASKIVEQSIRDDVKYTAYSSPQLTEKRRYTRTDSTSSNYPEALQSNKKSFGEEVLTLGKGFAKRAEQFPEDVRRGFIDFSTSPFITKESQSAFRAKAEAKSPGSIARGKGILASAALGSAFTFASPAAQKGIGYLGSRGWLSPKVVKFALPTLEKGLTVSYVGNVGYNVYKIPGSKAKGEYLGEQALNFGAFMLSSSPVGSSKQNVRVYKPKESKFTSDYLKDKLKGVVSQKTAQTETSKALQTLTERRVVKSKIGAAPREGELSVELKLRPIDSIKKVGKSSNVGGVERSTEYLIVKKGKPEFVNPKDIPKYDYVELTGTKKIITNPKTINKDNGYLNNQINFRQPKRITTSGSNVGSLSTNTAQPVYITKNVRDVVGAKKFNQQLGLSGARISKKDFVSRIDTLDFSGAKVFRKQSVSKSGSNAFTQTFEETNLNVRGGNFPKSGSAKPGSSYDRLSYKPNKYNSNQIEDQRFRVSFVDKKQLVARNIKSVTEFDSGYYVKLFTYDDKARVFKNVEVFLNKRKPMAAPVVTTFADVKKKYDSSPVEGDVSTGFGSGTVSILKTEKVNKPDLGKSLTKVDIEKPKVVSGSKSGGKSFGGGSKGGSFTGVSDGKFYPTEGSVGYGYGGKFYTPGGSGSRSRSGSGSGLIAWPGSSSSSQGGSRTGGGSGSRSGFSPIIQPISTTKPGLGSGQIQNPITGGGTRSKTETIPDLQLDQFSSQSFKDLSDLSFDFDAKKQKQQKFKWPDIKFDKNRKGYSVDVRRRGIFREEGRGLGFSKAVNLGKSLVGGSSAATFRIRQGRKIVPLAGGGQFYSKGGLNIERNKFRINTGGELRGITFQGVKKKRRMVLV